MTLDTYRLLDLEIADVLAGVPALAAADLVDIEPLREALVERARADLRAKPLPETVEITDVHVPRGPRLRLFRPTATDIPLPCLYSIHGGGYIMGSVEQETRRLATLVETVGCAAVAVEYRLAPQHPYPAPLDDCELGLRWLHEHAEELGTDAERIAVFGASAGGGLAAALAIRQRDTQGIPLMHQFLLYPMLDDRAQTPSSGWTVPVWSASANLYGWDAYLGDLAREDLPADAAAARVADVAGLPPAFLAVGALDLFVDEDLAYASRLLNAGVPVELHVYPGAPHGFDRQAPQAGVSQACVRDLSEAVATAFARPSGAPAR